VSPLVTQLHFEVNSIFKDNEVVEYALARSVSPALIAEYQTRLPAKKLLQRKLHEFYQLAAPVRILNATPTAKPRKSN
jgi:hypothetical protein